MATADKMGWSVLRKTTVMSQLPRSRTHTHTHTHPRVTGPKLLKHQTCIWRKKAVVFFGISWAFKDAAFNVIQHINTSLKGTVLLVIISFFSFISLCVQKQKDIRKTRKAGADNNAERQKYVRWCSSPAETVKFVIKQNQLKRLAMTGSEVTCSNTACRLQACAWKLRSYPWVQVCINWFSEEGNCWSSSKPG